MVRTDLGEHLGHVRVDVPVAERAGHGHAVMAVLHEVHVADPVHVDRRHRLAPPLRQVDALPAFPHALRGRAGTRGRTRASGPRSRRSSRAGIVCSPSLRSPTRPRAWTTSSNGRMWFTSSAPAEPGGQARERAPATCPAEVVLRVGAREAGVLGHQRLSVTRRARAVVFAALSAAMAVTRARTVRPFRRSRRTARGTRTVSCVYPLDAGSRAAARRRVSPISTVTPMRQSLSGQRAPRVMPPVLSGACVVAIRLAVAAPSCRRLSGAAHFPAIRSRASSSGSGSGSGTGGPAARRRRSSSRTRRVVRGIRGGPPRRAAGARASRCR